MVQEADHYTVVDRDHGFLHVWANISCNSYESGINFNFVMASSPH